MRNPVVRKDPLTEQLATCSATLEALLAKLESRYGWLLPPRDPGLRKYVRRLSDALADLTRLHGLSPLRADQRLPTLLAELEAGACDLTRERAWALLYEFQLLLIEVGDADVVCGMAEGELHWHKTDTSWLTWDSLFGSDRLPKAVQDYLQGAAPIARTDLDALRNTLMSLYRARHDDELARRERVQQRAVNLFWLARVLLVLLPAFIVFFYFAQDPRPSVWTVVLVPVAGALGAALSGTIKARDQLIREADIRRFRDGLVAQLLVGAVAAMIVVVVLEAELVTIGKITVGPDDVIAQAAFAFLAGFSEPFALGTIAKAANLGSPQDSSGNGKAAA